MYLSWLAKKEDMTGEIQGLSQRRLRKAVAEGMILSSAIFKDEDRFLLYIESIDNPVSPSALLPELASLMEKSRWMDGKGEFVPLTDIFHNNEPIGREDWERTAEYTPICKIARIYPQMVSSYIFYHYRLQEEQYGLRHQYGVIYERDGWLFFYKELPLKVGRPSRAGKMKTKDSPENWDMVMKPHFWEWNNAEGEKRIWRDSDLWISVGGKG